MERVKQFLLKNTSTKQTIIKNTFWLFAGEIPSRILKLIIVLFATRTLGVDGWGTFSYALSFISMFYVFGDIGISTFITREMSKKGENQYQFLSASFVLKIILLVLASIASLIFAPKFGTITLGIQLVAVMCILFFSDSFREFSFSINRALEKMEREAFVKILMNIIITGLGIILIIHKANPLSLAIAYAIGSVIASAIIIITLLPKLRLLTWKFPLSTIKIIFNFSWPFIAITLFSTTITNIDSIMLGQIKSATDVGFYAAAQRLIYFLTIIPTFIALSAFPLMSKNEGDDNAMKNIFKKIMVIILTIGIPIIIGGFMLKTEIFTLIFGASYAPGIPVFGVLIFSVFALFSNIVLSYIIFAKNLQKKFLVASVAGVIVSILLNLYLIPRYGATGAALSTTIAQLIITIINWQMLKNILPFSIMPKLGKIILANILMMLIILICNSAGIYFIVTMIIAIIGYMFILYMLKEPTINDILDIVGGHKNK